LAVDVPSSVTAAFGVGMVGFDLIAEEPRHLGGGVRNQGFLLREFQLERVMQKRTELFLDHLCLSFWPNETQKEIIGIAHIGQMRFAASLSPFFRARRSAPPARFHRGCVRRLSPRFVWGMRNRGDKRRTHPL